MSLDLVIKQVDVWPAQALTPLMIESEQEGFRFLKRLEQDWLNQINCFNQSGEAFFAVYQQSDLIAVGGVNRDSETAARLRRFYVAKAYRRLGVGSVLLKHLLGFAKQHYQVISLKTDTQVGDQFYQALGFLPYLTEQTTHVLNLNSN